MLSCVDRATMWTRPINRPAAVERHGPSTWKGVFHMATVKLPITVEIPANVIAESEFGTIDVILEDGTNYHEIKADDPEAREILSKMYGLDGLDVERLLGVFAEGNN